MLKKLLFLFLIPFILCSCSKNDTEEISFSSWGSATEIQILNKIIADFEHENPKIKINLIHIPQNYFQKLHLLFAAKQSPDVIFINNLYLPLFAEHLSEAHFNKNEFYKQSYEALSYQNKIYAVPRDISNLVFYYNKNLTTIPPDWQIEDFLPTLIKAKGKYKVSFERDIFWAEPYILTLGYSDGLKFYQQLEGTYAPTQSEVGSRTLAQMFINGDIALYLSGRWMYPKIKECADFNWGITVFPGLTPTDASGWAISKYTTHPQSAQKFVDFLASKHSIDYFTQTGLIIPARIDSSDNIQDGKVFLEAIKHSKPHIVDKNYKKIRDRKNKELFK